MDLQLILMVIGAIIVGIIVWDSWRRTAKNRNKAARNQSSFAPEYPKRSAGGSAKIEPVLHHFGDDPATTSQETIDIHDVQEQFSDTPTEFQDAKPVHRDENKNTDLIVFFILAKPGKQFSGIDLFHQFERLYLHFGEMDIFHRHKSETGEGPVIFSIASALEPGVFDYYEPENFATTGLTLFMQLPGSFSGSDAFETFLHTARLLTQRLDANLCDNKRQPMTTDTLEKYRQIAQQYG